MSINWYVLISQIECIHLNLAHTQKPETFQINKNYFRWFLKSNITQKHLNITKPHYPVKVQYQSIPVMTEIKNGPHMTSMMGFPFSFLI